jgi:DNA-binding MarR family transcriptional regulator
MLYQVSSAGSDQLVQGAQPGAGMSAPATPAELLAGLHLDAWSSPGPAGRRPYTGPEPMRRQSALAAAGGSRPAREELHDYFSHIADTRYLARKVFRLIDEQARDAGLEPLEHQALIQLFGAQGRSLQMKDLASRLDVGADVASKTVSSLQEKGYAVRTRSANDRRGIDVSPTPAAESMLAEIDLRVREHIALLQHDLPRGIQLAAVQMFAFYVGLAIDPDVLANLDVRQIELSPPWSGAPAPAGSAADG